MELRPLSLAGQLAPLFDFSMKTTAVTDTNYYIASITAVVLMEKIEQRRITAFANFFQNEVTAIIFRRAVYL